MNTTDLTTEIITSPEAKAFLRMVTKGFYDNSYVGLWIFEVIGREWDEMREWVEGFRTEIFPQTCTWTIAIWEWVYGIEPDDSLPLEYRRQRLFSRIRAVRPINPEVLRRSVITLIGGDMDSVEVNDFVAPYRFEVIIQPPKGIFWYNRVERHIWNIKPSHLAFQTVLETKVLINVLITAQWFLFPYGLTDQYPAGTRPNVNTQGHMDDFSIDVLTEGIGTDVHPEKAGTVYATAPGTDTQRMNPPSHTFRQSRANIDVLADWGGYQDFAPPTDEDQYAGEYPDTNVKARLEDADILIYPDEIYSELPDIPSGTLPDVQHSFTETREDITAEVTEDRFLHPYDSAGTKPQPNILGSIETIKVTPEAEGTDYEYSHRPTDDTEAGTKPDTQYAFRPEKIDVTAIPWGAGYTYENRPTDDTAAGTKPDTQYHLNQRSAAITAIPDGAGYNFAHYPTEEDTNAGTRPSVKYSGGTSGAEIGAISAGAGYTIPDGDLSGTKPDIQMSGRASDISVSPKASGSGYPYTVKEADEENPAGTIPGISTPGSENRIDVNTDTKGGGYEIFSPDTEEDTIAGTIPGASTPGVNTKVAVRSRVTIDKYQPEPPRTDTEKTGMYPGAQFSGGAGNAAISAKVEEKTWSINADQTGTKPDINLSGHANDVRINTGADGTGLQFQSHPTDDTETGTVPGPNRLFHPETAGVNVKTEGREYRPHPRPADQDQRTGTEPEVQYAFEKRTTKVGAEIRGDDYAATADSTGTKPDTNTKAVLELLNVSASPRGAEYRYEPQPTDKKTGAGLRPEAQYQGRREETEVNATAKGEGYEMPKGDPAGTRPDLQKQFRQKDSKINAAVSGKGHIAPRDRVTGTKPVVMERLRDESVEVSTKTRGTEYLYDKHPADQDQRTGTEPEVQHEFRRQSTSVEAQTQEEEFVIPNGERAGTKPDVSKSSQRPSGGITPVIDGEGFSVRYPMCGTGPTKSE